MIFTLLLAATLALASHPFAQQPSTPEATATPTLAVTPMPNPTPAAATPSPAPSATPSAAASPVTSPTPSAAPTGLNLPPLKYHIAPSPQPSAAPGTPQIFAIDINDSTVYSTKVLAIRVTTSEDVEKVTISSNGRSGQMTRYAPGRFESMGNIPKLPPLMGGINVNLVFDATTVDGRSTSVKVPLRVKR
jgi:hypothetical protein